MAQSTRLRAILVRVAPLAAMIVTTSVVASGARSPTHLAPELSWAAPSASWPLRCGEAGGDRARVVLRHLLPNLLDVVAVRLGSTAAAIVVSEAALAFVGFGTRDGVSLGSVLDQGVSAMLRAPHVLLVGAASVFLTSTAL